MVGRRKCRQSPCLEPPSIHGSQLPMLWIGKPAKFLGTDKVEGDSHYWRLDDDGGKLELNYKAITSQ